MVRWCDTSLLVFNIISGFRSWFVGSSGQDRWLIQSSRPCRELGFDGKFRASDTKESRIFNVCARTRLYDYSSEFCTLSLTMRFKCYCNTPKLGARWTPWYSRKILLCIRSTPYLLPWVSFPVVMPWLQIWTCIMYSFLNIVVNHRIN